MTRDALTDRIVGVLSEWDPLGLITNPADNWDEYRVEAVVLVSTVETRPSVDALAVEIARVFTAMFRGVQTFTADECRSVAEQLVALMKEVP